MSRGSVLIVEDESDIANLIHFHLSREGYAATIAQTGRRALDAIEQSWPDLVILDIMLPDIDGLEVCRQMKRDPESSGIPVLMVTARGDESDVVVGLELGAEDYVTKPFSPRVLMARVKAVLRRTETAHIGQIRLRSGEIVVDPGRHVVEIDGRPLDLTLTQYRLLHFLASRPGFVRTREQIVAAVRGEGTVLSSRAVDVHIAALRQRLGASADLIETVRGVGYRVASDRAQLHAETR